MGIHSDDDVIRCENESVSVDVVDGYSSDPGPLRSDDIKCINDKQEGIENQLDSLDEYLTVVEDGKGKKKHVKTFFVSLIFIH